MIDGEIEIVPKRRPDPAAARIHLKDAFVPDFGPLLEGSGNSGGMNSESNGDWFD